MAKYFNENGDEITEGVFSQEDLDAKIEEAKAVAIKEAEEAAAAGGDEEKKEEEEKEEEEKPAEGSVEATIAAIQDQLNTLSSNSEQTSSAKFTSELEDEQKAVFGTKFESLGKTGDYENTPEGLEQRASDAYQLTTGQAFDHGSLDMQNLSSVGGKAPTTPNKEQTEEDKAIGAALGNTPEDYEKHANKE